MSFRDSYDVYAPGTQMKLANSLNVKSGGVYSVVIQHNVSDPTTVSVWDGVQ